MTILLDDIEIEMTFVIGEATLPLDELSRLNRGAIIPLHVGIDKPIDVLANGSRICNGSVVLNGEIVAVTIKDLNSHKI